MKYRTRIYYSEIKVRYRESCRSKFKPQGLLTTQRRPPNLKRHGLVHAHSELSD